MVEIVHSVDMSRNQFALGRGMWAMTAITYALFLFVGAMVITNVVTGEDRGGVLFGLIWITGVVTSGLWFLLAEPRRVEVLAEGLRFVAPARTVFIPWTALKSVSSPWLDLNRQSLHWRFGRRKLHTWGPYDRDFQQLLALVQEHAPSADVRGAVTRRPTWGLRRNKPSRVEPS